jgi:hypothetical protein
MAKKIGYHVQARAVSELGLRSADWVIRQAIGKPILNNAADRRCHVRVLVQYVPSGRKLEASSRGAFTKKSAREEAWRLVEALVRQLATN